MLQAMKKAISKLWEQFKADIDTMPNKQSGLLEHGYLSPGEFYQAEAMAWKVRYEGAMQTVENITKEAKNNVRELDALKIDRNGWRARWADRGAIIDNQAETLTLTVEELAAEKDLNKRLRDAASYILNTYKINPSVRAMLAKIETGNV